MTENVVPTNVADVNLSDLEERHCLSPMKHGEHLFDVHAVGVFRCPGLAEDAVE